MGQHCSDRDPPVPHVLIIGGGFGGLQTARKLKRSPCRVTLVDRTNHHLFQPLLYQVATGVLSAPSIASPIRNLLRWQKNTTVLMDYAEKIDLHHREVFFSSGTTIQYDYLVIATGSRHSYFGRGEWEAHAPGLKTLQDSLNIRERILLAFEHAETSPSLREAENYLTFTIVGGGPTGVEMVGAIAEIAKQTMRREFRKINPSKTKIHLVEGAPRILMAYPPSLSKKAEQYLNKLGVKVITGQRVVAIDQEGVSLNNGHFIRSKNVIWAAGNEASPLVKTLNHPMDRQGRVYVNSDLSVGEHREVFVVGDAAHVKRKDDPVPAVATAAIQEGAFVGKLIDKELRGKDPSQRPAFLLFDKGMMATIGRYRAVMSVGKFRCGGLLAWLSWCFIHLFYLIGFHNKLFVATKWFSLFLKGNRSSRIIVTEEKQPPPPYSGDPS